jgi:hypothetical protein
MRRVALVLVFLLGVQAQAEAQVANPADTLCTSPAPPGVLQYVINLVTGSGQGSNRYKTQDDVEIVFENKNPFLFDYQFKIKEEALPEPGLESFFKLFSASTTPALAALPSATARGISDASENLEFDCQQALQSEEVKKLSSQEKQLLEDYASLTAQTKEISKIFNELKGEIDVQEKKLRDPAAACPSVVGAASQIVAAIQKRFDPAASGNLNERITQLEKGLAELAKSIERQSLSIDAAHEILKGSECSRATIQKAVGGFETTLDLLKKSLDSKDPKGLRQALPDFQTAAKEAQDKAKGISEVLQSSQNFRETRQVGNYDEITLVTITVDRKKKDETAFPSSPYIVKKLRFGGRQRFVLAAGAAFSSLDQIHHGIVQGVELDANGDVVLVNGAPNVTRVVGIEEESSQRVSPLIMLHTRLFEGSSWNSGYHFSFGFAGSTANNGIELEYLIGPSLSFAEERFFLTFGLYNGRTEELRKGFFIGRQVPALITSAPIVKGRDWDFGFAASFKFR